MNDGFPGTNADYIEHAIEHYKPSSEIVAILDEYRDMPSGGQEFPFTG